MAWKFAKYILVLTALSATPAAAQDIPDPLTLERTLQYVHQQNPTILAARYNLRATRELYPQAAAGWKPRIGAEANIVSTNIETGNFSEGDGATTKGASVNIEQPLFRGFRTAAEMAAARQRIAADEENIRRVEQETFLRTAESYMFVIRDRLLLDLQHKNKNLLETERESVRARFDAGDITQTDVRQTEARYSNAIADDAIAESQLQRSEAAFEELTGIWPSGTFAMPDITFQFPKKLDDLVKQAAARNPHLLARRNTQLAAEEDIRVAKSDFYPQLSAFASHIQEYDPQPGIVPDSNTSTIGIRARMSLYEGGATLSRVREARSRANQRFVEIVETEQGVRADIISEWRRLMAYESEINARELEVASARYSAEGVREEARLGDRTVYDTLEADQEVLDAERALVVARTDRIITAYRLAAALGMLDAATLGLPETNLPEDLRAASAE